MVMQMEPWIKLHRGHHKELLFAKNLMKAKRWCQWGGWWQFYIHVPQECCQSQEATSKLWRGPSQGSAGSPASLRECPQPGKLGYWAWAEDALLIGIVRDPPSRGTRVGMHLCLTPNLSTIIIINISTFFCCTHSDPIPAAGASGL